MFLPEIAYGSFTSAHMSPNHHLQFSSRPCCVLVTCMCLSCNFQGSSLYASRGDACVMNECTDIYGAPVLGGAQHTKMSKQVPGFLGLRGRREA